MNLKVVLSVVFLASLATALPLHSTKVAAGYGSAKYVLAIGLDGMGGSPYFSGVDALPPVLNGLAKRGAWTLDARGVMITDSKPNWSAIFMGAGPEETGIDGNGWDSPPDPADVDPITGKGTLFPTMFHAAKQYNSTIKTAMYTDHDVVINLLDMNDIDHFSYNKNADELTREFIQVIESPQGPPELMFIHYDIIDAAGHLRGWGSQYYYDAVTRADGFINQLIATLERVGILQQTMIIITSDHGGQLRSHGIFSNSCLLIPFVMNGPCITQGTHLTSYTRNMDYPPTILHALGIPAPSVWIGRVVEEAFSPRC